MGVESIVVAGRDAWLKAYDQGDNRRLALGLLDAVAAFEHATGALPPQAEGLCARYHRQVWLAPPWPALYRQDAERRQGPAQALAEYHRLRAFLPRFGYEIKDLPRVPVLTRAAILRAALA